MRSFISARREIERMGYRVLATTKNGNFISFDALPRANYKRGDLVRGPWGVDDRFAMNALLWKIHRHQQRKQARKLAA